MFQLSNSKLIIACLIKISFPPPRPLRGGADQRGVEEGGWSQEGSAKPLGSFLQSFKHVLKYNPNYSHSYFFYLDFSTAPELRKTDFLFFQISQKQLNATR